MGIENLNHTLPDRLRALERRVDQLSKGAPLRSASISSGGLRVGDGGAIRSTNFDGTDASDPGTVGWWLGGPHGDAVFNNLVLRAGIIGNDALANPIGTARPFAAVNNMAVPNSYSDLAQTTVPAPAGFTKAIVLVTGYAKVTMTTSGSTFFWVRPVIAGVAGEASERSILDGQQLSETCAGTGLVASVGAGVTVAVQVATGGGSLWAATPGNRAVIEGIILWLR